MIMIVQEYTNDIGRRLALSWIPENNVNTTRGRYTNHSEDLARGTA